MSMSFFGGVIPLRMMLSVPSLPPLPPLLAFYPGNLISGLIIHAMFELVNYSY